MPPSFDLVVATVDRVAELERLFDSLERQTHRDFRVLLVDQNDDDRVEGIVRDHTSLNAVRMKSARGLSRARNAALGELRADVVAFPDDDCIYPEDLLERLAQRFADDPSLDGLTGRGGASSSWARNPAILTRDNLWNRAISYAVFMRRELVERIGRFDESLGLPTSSGEEIDYLVRAVDEGARIAYDPTIVVGHDSEARDPYDLAVRDGKSIGYILRKHAYPAQTLTRMLVRPAGGLVLAALRNDRERVRVHAATLQGRLAGYRRS